MEVIVGTVGDELIHNVRAIVGESREAFAVVRPQALAVVDLACPPERGRPFRLYRGWCRSVRSQLTLWVVSRSDNAPGRQPTTHAHQGFP